MQKSSASTDDTIKKAIAYALSSLNQKQAFTLIKRLLKEKAYGELKTGKKTIGQLEFKDLAIDGDIEKSVNEFDVTSVLAEHRQFLDKSTPFKNNELRGIVANGWVFNFCIHTINPSMS
jgi:hypothetical protein